MTFSVSYLYKVLDNASGPLDKIKKKAKQVDDSVVKNKKSFGDLTSKVGPAITLGVTAAMGVAVGAIYKATDAADEFNKNLANVASLSLSNERVLELGESVKMLAVDSGKDLNEIAVGLYDVVSAFGDSAETSELLTIVTRNAVAGSSTISESLNAISAATKGYGDTSVAAASKWSDLFLKTVELGQTTMPELASSIQKVTASSATLGVSEEELMGVFAATTGAVGSAAQVSTQLNGIYTELLKPGKNMSAMIQKLGFESGVAMSKELGLAGTLAAVSEYADGAGLQVANMFGSIEGGRIATALTGELLDAYSEKTAKMGDAAGQTERALAAQMDGVNSLGKAKEQLASQIQVLWVEWGNRLYPVVEKFTGVFSSVIEYLVQGTGAFAGVMKIVGFLAIVFGPLIAAIILYNMWTKIAAITQAALNFVMLLNPVALIIIGILALIGVVIAIIKYWDDIIAVLKKVWDWMTKLWEAFMNDPTETLKKIGQAIIDFLLFPIKKVVELFGKLTGLKGVEESAKNWGFGTFGGGSGAETGVNAQSPIPQPEQPNPGEQTVKAQASIAVYAPKGTTVQEYNPSTNLGLQEHVMQ